MTLKTFFSLNASIIFKYKSGGDFVSAVSINKILFFHSFNVGKISYFSNISFTSLVIGLIIEYKLSKQPPNNLPDILLPLFLNISNS
jgi:hypothetical protein